MPGEWEGDIDILGEWFRYHFASSYGAPGKIVLIAPFVNPVTAQIFVEKLAKVLADHKIASNLIKNPTLLAHTHSTKPCAACGNLDGCWEVQGGRP